MIKLLVIVLALFSCKVRAESYANAVTVDGQTILITAQAYQHIQNDGLLEILDQAASAPVFDADGDQIGYRLTDITPGSVFETVGLQNRDVVLEIDGVRLVDPKTAVDALRNAKGLDDFSVVIRRHGKKIKLHVLVK